MSRRSAADSFARRSPNIDPSIWVQFYDEPTPQLGMVQAIDSLKMILGNTVLHGPPASGVKRLDS